MRFTRHSTRALLFLLAAAVPAVPAAADVEAKAWHAGNVRAVEAWTQARQKETAGSTNAWVARGVVADRAARQVQFVVEASGVAAGGIVEFMTVAEKSEKDYEALTVALARAGDVCQALEFIGVPRGRPVKPSICRFWPKGERVKADIRPLGGATNDAMPLQRCLADRRSEAAFPGNYVYVGSCWSGTTCQADNSLGAFISTYNEPSAVLDTPLRAPQGEVYGNLVASSQWKHEAGTLLLVTLTPDFLSNGVPRTVDFTFTARRSGAAAQPGVGSLECVTRATEPALGTATNDVKGALERLAAQARAGRDPFVTLAYDDHVTVGAARDLTRILQSVEGPGGVRVEDPPAGQLYYRAFLPDERWRPRAERPTQPWELRVRRGKDGAWDCTLVQILEDWSREGQLTPDLTPSEHPLAHPSDLPGKIQELIAAQAKALRAKHAQAKGDPGAVEDYVEQMATLKRISTLFVFAPEDAPLGAFLPAVRLVQKTLPQVHVFVEN